MRLALVLLPSLVASVIAIGPASAQGDIEVGGGGNAVTATATKTWTRSGQATSAAGAPTVRGGDGSGGAAPAAPRPIVSRDQRGVTYDYTSVGGGEMRYTFDPTRDYCDWTADYVECFGPRPPRRPGGERPAPAPPPITPSEIVERTIVNVRLPRPRPNIDPGHAVTGLRAYLETGNRRSHSFAPIATVLGPLRITATSTYTVDWGDGTITGPHRTVGAKYPDGDITHVYRDAATVDVTVAQNWTARWRLAGQSGTIGGLRSAAQITDFEIREVQAVRRR